MEYRIVVEVMQMNTNHILVHIAYFKHHYRQPQHLDDDGAADDVQQDEVGTTVDVVSEPLLYI